MNYYDNLYNPIYLNTINNPPSRDLQDYVEQLYPHTQGYVPQKRNRNLFPTHYQIQQYYPLYGDNPESANLTARYYYKYY